MGPARPGPPPPRSRPGSGPVRRGGDARLGARRAAAGSARMKKHQHSVQGTFSRLFGKRHASPAAASLFATNPPWIFTQEVTSDSAGGTGQCPLSPPPGRPVGAHAWRGLRAGAGADGAGGRRWWPVGSPVGEPRRGVARPGHSRASFGPPSGKGSGGGADSAQRDGTPPPVRSPRRNPLREAQLGRRGLIKSCESVLLLPGALSHAMFELRLPRL